MRGAAQLIAYEIPILMVVLSIIIMTGSLNFNVIVAFQQAHMWLMFPLFIGFITFFVCGIAESERVPFDLPEAEAELVEGWQTEYGGIQWGLIMMADYLRAYVVSALVASALPGRMGRSHVPLARGLVPGQGVLGLLHHDMGKVSHGPYQDRPAPEDRMEEAAPAVHRQPGHRRCHEGYGVVLR